jgi:hypothetical protein
VAAELPDCGRTAERQSAAGDGDDQELDGTEGEEAATSHGSRYNRRRFNVCERRLKAS